MSSGLLTVWAVTVGSWKWTVSLPLLLRLPLLQHLLSRIQPPRSSRNTMTTTLRMMSMRSIIRPTNSAKPSHPRSALGGLSLDRQHLSTTTIASSASSPLSLNYSTSIHLSRSWTPTPTSLAPSPLSIYPALQPPWVPSPHWPPPSTLS